MSVKSLDELASELVLNHKGPLVDEVPEGPGGHVGAVMDSLSKSDEEGCIVVPDTIEQDAQNIVPVESFEDKVMEGVDSDTSTHDMPIVNNEGLKEPDAEYGKYWTEKSVTQMDEESLNKKGLTEMEDYLEKTRVATPIKGITPGGYRRVAKDKYVKVESTQQKKQYPYSVGSPAKEDIDRFLDRIQDKEHTTVAMAANNLGIDHMEAMNGLNKLAKEGVLKGPDWKGTYMRNTGSYNALESAVQKIWGKKDEGKKKYDTPYETVKHPPSVAVNKKKFRDYFESAKQVSPTQYHPPQDKNAIRSELSKLPKGTFVEYTDESGYHDTSMVKISDTHWSDITGGTETTKQIAEGIYGQTHSQKGKVTVNITKQSVKKSLDGLSEMGYYLSRFEGDNGSVHNEPASSKDPLQKGEDNEAELTGDNTTLNKSGQKRKRYEKPSILEIIPVGATDGAETDFTKGEKTMEGLEALAKALPGHEPKINSGTSNTIGGSANGGNLEGTGTTSGAIPAAPGPGQDKDGQLKGVTPGKVEKLSEDDKEDEQQMKEHKKPIETTRKSVYPAGQRDTVAHELAQYRSQMEKSADGNVFMSADEQAANYVKNEGFYRGPSPTLNVNRDVLLKGYQECPECKEGFSKSLSGCPSCGWNAIGHRVLPQTFLGQNSTKNKPMLRKAQQEADIVIGCGGPAYIVKQI